MSKTQSQSVQKAVYSRRVKISMSTLLQRFRRVQFQCLAFNSSPFSTTIASRMAPRPKVFLSRPDIPESALKTLQDKCDVISWTSPCTVPRDWFLKNVKGVDGIFCVLTEQINQEVIDAAGPSLKVVGTMSVGFDHIDVPTLKKAGIKLGFTPNVLTDATAETTVAVLLAASRRLFESHQHLLNGNWGKFNWGPTWMVGQGLAGSTVGIVGMGRIGQAVKDRLTPFKVAKFIYFDNYINNVPGATKTDFDRLCRESDFVIANCALTDETREIFNEHAFGLMKPNAVFVNTSRGGVVKQSALVDALRNHKIFAAGLDVMTPEPLPPDHELTKLENCVVIPHLGSATVESRRDMAELTVKNILAALDGSVMPAPIP